MLQSFLQIGFGSMKISFIFNHFHFRQLIKQFVKLLQRIFFYTKCYGRHSCMNLMDLENKVRRAKNYFKNKNSGYNQGIKSCVKKISGQETNLLIISGT